MFLMHCSHFLICLANSIPLMLAAAWSNRLNCESPDLILHIALSDEHPTVRCGSRALFGSRTSIRPDAFRCPLRTSQIPATSVFVKLRIGPNSRRRAKPQKDCGVYSVYLALEYGEL